MAKVFLRVYNREIESMIEGGQLDEAVAHCQYILKTFPMHVDTYRLLGKAFLEARRYADAADIFERVLMAVPDDFVSHVGMSIIRDDENKMDDAIWHMERAFEVQPSNSAIQGELRRLYGRRDGVEPSKIRLSRDALANMYSQGELFNQAIAEIRSVLAEDNNRPDLQVMLARAYYRSGQKVEAAEMAATLLKKYPYCMDSLRVLVDVLPGTARAENTQVYRQRLHNLDPYSSFTVSSVFASDQVVDSAVNLERLDYRSGPATASSQPDWASSLGIKLNDESHAETPPVWMLTAETPEQAPASSPEPPSLAAAPVVSAVADSVPEWMRSAGWQESTNAAQATPTDSGESLDDKPIAKADIPDWLQSMAPTETVEENNPESEEPAESLSVGEDGIPNWLKPTGSLEAAGKANLGVQPPAELQPAATADVPDWLKSMAPSGIPEESNPLPQQPLESQPESVEPQPAGEDETPDWLKSMAPAEAVDQAPVEDSDQTSDTQPVAIKTQPARVDDTPEWLKTLAVGEAVEAVNEAPVEASTQPVQPQPAPVETQSAVVPANVDETPDWLKSLDTAETVGEAQLQTPLQPPVEPPQVPAAAQPVNAEEVPDWLKSLTAAETVDEAQVDAPVLPAEPQQAPVPGHPINAEEVPEWLKSLDSAETVGGAQAEPLIKPVEHQQESVAAQPVNAEEVPDWLKSLDAAGTVGETQGEPSVLPVEPQQAPSAAQPVNAEEVPDWLKSMAPADVATDVQPDATAEPVESQPVADQPQPVSQPVNEEEVPDWLKSLATTDAVGKAQAEPQVPVESVQAPAEPQQSGQADVLEWLKSLDSTESAGAAPIEAPQPPVEPTPASAEPAPASSGGVPDWFKSLAAAKAVEEASPETPQSPAEPQPVGVDATPDWLKPLAPAAASADVHVEAAQPPVEPEPETPAAIPDWLKSLAPAENAGVQNTVSEPVPVDAPASKEPETVSMPVETSPAKLDAFPDWLAGAGARADAAALIAKALEQEHPVVDQPLISKTPVVPESAAQAPAKPSVSQASTSPEAFQPSGEVKPLNIGDDAFSWLESLAAKQGAKPEELLTKPEDRSDEMPDWLRQPLEKPVDEPVPPAPAPVRTPAETLPLEPLSRFDAAPVSKPAQPIVEPLPAKEDVSTPVPPAGTTAQPATPLVSGEDDTLSWLERMTGDQEEKPEEPLQASVLDAATTPDWIQKVQEDQPAGSVPEETIPATPESAPAQDDISITTWLSKLEVDEALEKKSSQIPSQAAPATPAADLPDWLKDLDKPEPPVEAPKSDHDLPEWLRNPISSDALESLPPVPAAESIPEQELPAWVDENASLTTGQALPTLPEEWLPAETKAENISAPSEPVPVEKPPVETATPAEAIPPVESIPVPAPVRTPTLKQTGMLSHIPVLDKDAELLSSAQNILDQNSLDEAMKKYSKLIKKGRLLDEVIHDLREAIYRYPVDVIIWQTLGDAYMRANRLQDALDSYTKAEELLR
jgi:tetratricopeptide (TPR) repeat protein